MKSANEPADTKQMSFRDAYDKLRTHAETLRNQEEPDIDNLLTTVTESIEAYRVCKDRIDAVDKALEQAFAREPAAAGEVPKSEKAGAPRAPARNASPKGEEDQEGDIPF